MPLRERGSGSLAFPAPSFALAVTSRASEVFPCAQIHPEGRFALPRGFSTIPDGIPRVFAACSNASARADHLIPLRSLLAPRAGAAKPELSPARMQIRGLASSGDSVVSPPRGPLHRFSVSTVYSRMPCRNRTPFGPAAPTAWDHVPPSWFLTTSTVFSGLTVRALLQLAADPGVHRVSLSLRLHPHSPEGGAPARRGRSPRCSHPSKMLPARSACFLTAPLRRVSRSRSPLPPCRFVVTAPMLSPSARARRG